MGLLTRKAQSIGQESHRAWSLKFAIDHYLAGRTGLRVLDCGAWNGWFLSYNVPAIAQRIALDFDAHFAAEMRAKGIDFVLADMEKGYFPLADGAVDLLAMTSTLEHLGNSQQIAAEIRRVLSPGGIVFVTVPDILKYRFHFWDDVTHKRPFNAVSLRFLFETQGFETVELCRYNHNLFIAGNLFPAWIHRRLMRLRGRALLYVGRRPAG
ncbi:MAG: class I SAM-dependent methyltransferase [Candidatus Hydrogenedentes bacterium]|nr:class I SAM-dependent methyltransferase [Candidatus Hydrogenedentota bacterium]